MDLELEETGNATTKKEIWADVVGYEGYYKVSSKGRIKGVRRTIVKSSGPVILKPRKLTIRINKNGYVRITLSKNNVMKTMFVHRLMAEAFIPNPENKPQVNHKNCIRSDNRIDNLEWVTSSENIKHKFLMGYKQDKGDADSQSKQVEKLDLNGNILKIYGSIREAERESKVFRAAIRKCTIGHYSQAGGFVWRLK